MSKLSSLQPRYKLEENSNPNSGDKSGIKMNSKIIAMIADSNNSKNSYKSNLGQNYLNISANDRHMFKERIATTKYNINDLKSNFNIHQSKQGMLLKN